MLGYSKVPTLKNIAKIKLAVLLCNDPEVQTFSKLVNSVDFYEEWQQLINRKASKLFFPTNLHKAVCTAARRVGLEIRERNIHFHVMHWKMSSMFGKHCQCLKGLLPSIYRWTPEGYIDMRKTVRAIVQDHRVDIAFRFSLSCYYVLGNETILLWNEMSNAMRERFFASDLKYQILDWIKQLLIVGDVKWQCFVGEKVKTPSEIIMECDNVAFLNTVFQKVGKEWSCRPEFHGEMYHVPVGTMWWRLDFETHVKCLEHMDNDLGLAITPERISENGVSKSFRRAKQRFIASATRLWPFVRKAFTFRSWFQNTKWMARRNVRRSFLGA